MPVRSQVFLRIQNLHMIFSQCEHVLTESTCQMLLQDIAKVVPNKLDGLLCEI